ncbi:hypothetical protein FGO68_gene13449 [Halteria grandinella]|uniref:Uncharacterized protein n=1 Tax=Halteria grandinella TaxID=5974 RepID=A0A8J8NKI1_HALGN|nr:hypothetical protein FGO68_gene13449 [Halteria grandinella]
MLRPSFCAKFVLQSAVDSGLFYDKDDKCYTYHGTKSKNVASILKYGLQMPNLDDPSKSVAKQENGNAVGDTDTPGIYTTKFPQYAEHYTDTIKHQGYNLSFMFLCRQDYQDSHEIDTWETLSSSTLDKCSCDMLQYLHQDDEGDLIIRSDEVQYKVTDPDMIDTQALLIFVSMDTKKGCKNPKLEKLLEAQRDKYFDK